MCPIPPQQLTMMSELIKPLSTLLAAFLGAWLAFMLQNRRERKNEVNTNLGSINKVQINLIQQLNALTIFNNDFLLPHLNHPIMWVAIPAAPHRDYSKLRIDAGSLSFLIENGYSELISNNFA